MPLYRIHRLRAGQRPSFRSAPHTSGATTVKPRDYTEGGTVEAPSLYAAWTSLHGTPQLLEVGDLLESEEGSLHICKYIGFEEAHWVLPEVSNG